MRDEDTFLALQTWNISAPGTHQQTVEELVDKEPHGTDHEIQQVVEELNIQNHGPVPSGECPTVAHKAHQKDDFIADLKTMTGRVR